MRMKVRRVFARVSVGLAGLVAVVLVACFDEVDYRPYFREPYYKETITRWRAHVATNSFVQGELFAGFGRARLTPTINATEENPSQGKFRSLSLAGYGDRKGKPASGVHDDLFIKCVALRVADRLGVMLGADALIVPREVADVAAERLHKELGLSREQLYLSATHTHCSIGGWGEGKAGEAFAGKFNPGARSWFVECLVMAVRGAIADLKPASFGYGSFAAPQFVRNRLVGDLGKVDPEFSYAVVKQDNGRMAVLGSYAAHATVLSGSVMEFSADYPGYWQRAVEQSNVAMAVFLAGSVGSHGPVAGEGGFPGAERMGHSLAQLCLEAVSKTILTNSISFSTLGLDVTLPPLNIRVTDGIRVRPWIAGKLLPAERRSFLQVFRIADSVWISTPCDFSGELALGIKDALRAQGRKAVITSFNGDYIGYVIPSRYYHLDGYEPRLMSFFGPNVPDYLNELIRTMTLEMGRGNDE
jgi:neutral ceramidase